MPQLPAWIWATALGVVLALGLYLPWRAERILKIKGNKLKIDKTGATLETDEAATKPDTLSPEELAAIEAAAGAHECQRDDDFKQFALVLQAMGDLLTGLAQRALDPTAKADVVAAPLAVLGVRMGDYRRHLVERGYVT